MKIVLIEDDADDVDLLQEALHSQNVTFSMTVIRDGSAAMNYIKHTTHLPDIIIMDFNLPRVHGREIVSSIRSQSKFLNVPILILSTSSSKEDIDYAYAAGADKYLIKPATIETIQQTVETIVELVRTKVGTS